MKHCMLVLLLIASLVATPVFGEVVAEFNFEDAETGWRPRADTIEISRVEDMGATDESTACLHIKGPIETGWNYAISDHAPMEAGQLYRLSAWVRVDSHSETTPPPFLKCEFVPKEKGASLGRSNTTSYDYAKMGQWQKLFAEFHAPKGVDHCWLALEKGSDIPMEIDAYLDEVVLETIDKLTVPEKYKLGEMPESMKEMSGVHPRLYLTAEKLAELRHAAGSTHQHLWEEVQEHADRVVKRGPREFEKQDKEGEQLWQRGMGNDMPYLAMAYIISGNRTYLQACEDWALASCSYSTWGSGARDGKDLAAGHQLFGLAMIYDWCHDDLSPETRQTILDCLKSCGNIMFEAAKGSGWWDGAYLQNHLWVNVCGLAAAGLAIYDEHPEAGNWVGTARAKFQRTMDALGPDGASHEGYGYWEYGVEYMLKFMHLSRQLLDEDMFDNQWWRNTAKYGLYCALPRDAWDEGRRIVNIADCPLYHWYGPDYLLRKLAAEYDDGYAQWLADRVDEADVDSPQARWLNLVWYDPDVEPTPPDDLPTMHHFDDMEIVSCRTGWSGDETMVFFKCGPYIGHEAIDEFFSDPGGGHVHPDANHLLIFANNDFVLRDDGYRPKWTGHHNTLMIDGSGQLGEGKMWLQGAEQLRAKAHPKILAAESHETFHYIVGDATEAYAEDCGLQQFIRHVIFMKPNVVIVADDITCEGTHDLELRFHPGPEEAQQDGSAYMCTTEDTVMRFEPLTTRGVEVAAKMIAGQARHGGEIEDFTIQLKKNGSEWRNVTAVTWADAGEEPPQVQVESSGDGYLFTAGDRAVRLDWQGGASAVQ
ncbi:MAG: DUF4962 domain-containing protein [Armatimonadota bacterium]